MAPEQVRGVAADHRADIFAFGAVMHEMLSGQRAFHGETAMDAMTAIIKDHPADLPAAERKLPPALVRIVERCLEKSPAARFQSTRDLALMAARRQGDLLPGPQRHADGGGRERPGRELRGHVDYVALRDQTFGRWRFPVRRVGRRPALPDDQRVRRHRRRRHHGRRELTLDFMTFNLGETDYTKFHQYVVSGFSRTGYSRAKLEGPAKKPDTTYEGNTR